MKVESAGFIAVTRHRKTTTLLTSFPKPRGLIPPRLSVRRLIRKGSFVTRFSAEYISVKHGRERSDEKRHKGIGKE